MSRVIYVEPDEEITDLVDRIRRTGDERDLVFVMPARARVLQSPLNLRLLQQYSRSFVKNTAIVSGDARVQELARGAGFPTYASVQAYERGVEVMRPLSPSDGGAPAAAAVGAGAATALLEDEPAVADPWAVPAAPPPPSRPPRAPLPPGLPGRARGGAARRPFYFAAAGLFVLGLLLLFLVAPSAQVRIALRAPQLSVSRTVQGTTDPTAATGPDHVLTQSQSADESSQFVAKASGKKTIAAVPSSTTVVISSDAPFSFCLKIAKGSVLGSTAGNPVVTFAASATPAGTCVFGDGSQGVALPASPDGQFDAQTEPLQVQATTAGAGTNVAAGAVTQVDPKANPCNPDNYPQGSAPQCDPNKDIKITNTAAATGGVDQHDVTVVSSQDLASWQQQVDQAKKQLSDKVKQDMQAKAPGATFAVDPTGQGLTLNTDVNPALPNAGDQYSQQTITVAAHGKAAMYKADDVRKVVLADLSQRLAANERLAQASVKTLNVQSAVDDGTVVFNASAVGYRESQVNTDKLKDQFSGKSRSSVTRTVQDTFEPQNIESVNISQSVPFFVLPFFSSRIEVDISYVPVQDSGTQSP